MPIVFYRTMADGSPRFPGASGTRIMHARHAGTYRLLQLTYKKTRTHTLSRRHDRMLSYSTTTTILLRKGHTDFAVDRSQRSTRGAGCIWAGATGPRKLFRLEFHILFSFYFFMCSIFVFNFFMFYFLSSTFFCLFLLFFLNFCVKKFSPNFLSHNLLLNFFGS